jgi:hypothetical protein
MAAKMAAMDTTRSSSIKVNPACPTRADAKRPATARTGAAHPFFPVFCINNLLMPRP